MTKIFQSNVKDITEVVTGLYDKLKDIRPPDQATFTSLIGISGIPGATAMDDLSSNDNFFETPLFIGIMAGTGLFVLCSIVCITYSCLRCSANSTAGSYITSEQRFLGINEDSEYETVNFSPAGTPSPKRANYSQYNL